MLLKVSAILAFTTGVVGLVGCTKTGPNASAQMEEALKTLQGRWDVVSLDRSGKQTAQEALKNCSAFIRHDHFFLFEAKGGGTVSSGESEEYMIQLDPTKAAGEFEFAYLTGANQGQVRQGIYALEGDQLKMCWGELGKDRPADFTAAPGYALIVLERKK